MSSTYDGSLSLSFYVLSPPFPLLLIVFCIKKNLIVLLSYPPSIPHHPTPFEYCVSTSIDMALANVIGIEDTNIIIIIVIVMIIVC